MKINFDYHMHTIMDHTDHAKNTVEEMVLAAKSRGLEGIAITNHGLGHKLYGMQEKDIDEIKSEILSMRKKYPDMKILFGVEANILSLNGDTDITDEMVEKCDIILCGYHYTVKYKTFKDFWNLLIMNYVAKAIPFIRKIQIKKNTKAICRAMKKNNIDILTHPGDKIFVDMDEIAAAAEETNTVLEINTSHRHLSLDEIKICEKYNIKYAANSDSHIAETVGLVEDSLQRIEEAKLDLDKIINVEV